MPFTAMAKAFNPISTPTIEPMKGIDSISTTVQHKATKYFLLRFWPCFTCWKEFWKAMSKSRKDDCSAVASASFNHCKDFFSPVKFPEQAFEFRLNS